MKRYWRLAAVAAAALMATAVKPIFSADQDTQRPADVKPFSGKVVVLSMRANPQFGIAMEQARVATLGGATFVVGTAADDGQPGNWMKGRTSWVPMTEVLSLVEFPSLDDFKATEGKPAP